MVEEVAKRAPGDAIIHDRVTAGLDVFAILLERLLCSRISANPS
jgi:hypothetical protein